MNFKKNYNMLDSSSKEVETKNGLSYLSWGYANKFIRENFNQIKEDIITSYIKELGIVGCQLKLWDEKGNAIEHTEFLAITDFKNKPVPIDQINQNQIMHTYKRAFAKNVAVLTGYAMALYTGEDLKAMDLAEKAEQESIKLINKFFDMKPENKPNDLVQLEKIYSNPTAFLKQIEKKLKMSLAKWIKQEENQFKVVN